MLSGLVAFLITALIVALIAWAIVYVIDLIPGVPPPAAGIAKLLVGVIALIVILMYGLPLLGVAPARL